MLDLVGIMFSSVMMLYVIIQAARLDRSEPWFKPVSLAGNSGKAAEPPPRRRG